MPICLIIPPSAFELDERVWMNLGILKVAAVLEQQGCAVEMLDLSGIENYEEAVVAHARTTKAKYFGITATSSQMPAAKKIVAAIRSANFSAKIILGGPHATLVNAAAKKEQLKGVFGRASKTMRALSEDFNTIVCGDGEESVFLAIEENAPKLIDADDPKSYLFLDSSRLDALPYPARHLLDVSSYHYNIEGERALSLIAQLGCPFECGFCGGRYSPFLRRVRTRSIDNIVSEIKQIYEKYGVKGFMFQDDELNVNKKMLGLMDALSLAQKEIGVFWRFRGLLKAELFTDAQAEAMKKAGFSWVLIGFESGSPRILENINKKATREENTRAVEIARRHGLKVKALMSLGHPGESLETVLETYDWLLQVKPDDFDVTIITTYPGTPYYDDAVRDKSRNDVWIYSAKKTGDKLYGIEIDYSEVAQYYKGNPDGGYNSYVYTDNLSTDDLVDLRDMVERDLRARLGIPYPASSPALRFEHSMGQLGPGLPPHIMKTSK